jgi:hypothetical protein
LVSVENAGDGQRGECEQNQRQDLQDNKDCWQPDAGRPRQRAEDIINQGQPGLGANQLRIARVE